MHVYRLDWYEFHIQLSSQCYLTKPIISLMNIFKTLCVDNSYLLLKHLHFYSCLEKTMRQAKSSNTAAYYQYFHPKSLYWWSAIRWINEASWIVGLTCNYNSEIVYINLKSLPSDKLCKFYYHPQPGCLDSELVNFQAVIHCLEYRKYMSNHFDKPVPLLIIWEPLKGSSLGASEE